VETPREDSGGRAEEFVPIRAVVGTKGRFYAALICLACAGILGLAAWLKPDPKGYGTHRQLGFGKCGMLITTGLPCPTCGMTTAFAYAVRGRLIKSFLAQPAGMVLALGTMLAAIVSGWVSFTGRMPRIRIPMITTYRLLLAMLVLLIGGWGFKIIMGLLDGSLPDRG
jgi:hypothetical protein